MPRELEVHRWKCPICSETKTSLATMDTMDGKEQAANALVSHIRTSDRGGHGREGAYPLDFDADDALDYIVVANSGDPVKDEDRLSKMNAGR